MKKPVLTVLVARMKCIGSIKQDSIKFSYYTDILNKIRPDDAEEVSVSWTENLLNPHLIMTYDERHGRIELVRKWYDTAQKDEVKNKDGSLMMEMELLINAIGLSCLSLVDRYALKPIV